MRRREMLAIAGVVATPLLFAWLVVVMLNTPAEGLINKDQAIEIVSQYYLADRGTNVREPRATFALIRDDDTTAEGDHRFFWHDAEQNSKSITGYHGHAVFSSSEGNYFSSELKDRYVWVVFIGEYCYSPYFVDAATGELVGISGYEGFCTYCWHMYHPETYDDYITFAPG